MSLGPATHVIGWCASGPDHLISRDVRPDGHHRLQPAGLGRARHDGDQWTIPVTRDDVREARAGRGTSCSRQVVQSRATGCHHSVERACCAWLELVGSKRRFWRPPGRASPCLTTPRDSSTRTRRRRARWSQSGDHPWRHARPWRARRRQVRPHRPPVFELFRARYAPVWSEVARLLVPGGVLLAGFINPIAFIFDADSGPRRPGRASSTAVPVPRTWRPGSCTRSANARRSARLQPLTRRADRWSASGGSDADRADGRRLAWPAALDVRVVVRRDTGDEAR